MLILEKHNSLEFNGASYHWGQLADWIARNDHHIPIYHQVCLRLWRWALERSVR
jgi:hypothetical protein